MNQKHSRRWLLLSALTWIACAFSVFYPSAPSGGSNPSSNAIRVQSERAREPTNEITPESQMVPAASWAQVLSDGIHKSSEAVSELEKYIATHPNEKEPLALALLDPKLLPPDKRQHHAMQLLALAPGDVLATQVLADISLQSREVNEAIRVLKESYEIGGFTDYFSMLRNDYVDATVAAGTERTEALANYQFTSRNTSILQTDSLWNSIKKLGGRKLGTTEQRNTITALLLDIVQRGIASGKLDMVSETRSREYAREILYHEVGGNNANFSGYLSDSLQSAAKQAAEEASKSEALWLFSGQQDRTTLFEQFTPAMKAQFSEMLETNGEVTAWKTLLLANPALFREHKPTGVAPFNWPADFDRALVKLR